MAKKTGKTTTATETGAMYGYARVSTKDQDLTVQRDALKAAGCTVIREEKASGTTRKGRGELETLLTFMRAGDVLVVTRIDRLARSMRDLQNLVHELRERGIHLKATEQPVDTSTSAGKAFLDMLGVFAEFETNLRAERQAEGIARARDNGEKRENGQLKYAGRPATDTAERIRVMHAQGIGASAICKELGLKSRTSVYDVIKPRKAKVGA
jgi:DNA invertase Pin-like site-specific DNA recombinase